MRKYIKTALILGAICAVSAVILALMNMVTKPIIDEYEESKVTNALKEVSNGMELGERTEVNEGYVSYRIPLSSGGKVSGYILGLTSNGYGGELTLVASYDKNGVILAAKLIADSETPGLGKKAENEGYMDKFVGTGTSTNPVPTSKSMLSEADAAAVSGASMTFTGISKALAYGSNYVKSL